MSNIRIWQKQGLGCPTRRLGVSTYAPPLDRGNAMDWNAIAMASGETSSGEMPNHD
jgi:hypothetical protein